MTDTAGREEARYIRILPFGVHVPIEGKNRVTLARQVGMKLRARVVDSHYPPANELQLRRVRPWPGIVVVEYAGGEQDARRRPFWSISISMGPRLLRRYAALVLFRETIELLEAYGVQWGDPVWNLTAPLVARMARIKIARSYYHK